MTTEKVPQRIHRSTIRKPLLRGTPLGGSSLFLIAGPCIVEDVGICTEIAAEAERVCRSLGIQYIFKASYDKANKTVKASYRGPGWKEGLKQLELIKTRTGLPLLTDVHEVGQCAAVAEVADILQIPALLSKQIDLILAAARTGRIVNIKKGQFVAPWEANNVLARMMDEGFEEMLITERGYMFGYQTLVADMRSLQIMSRFGFPVIFDGSHTVHGSAAISAETSLMHRDFIRPLVRSAVANGVDGIFIEVHPEPEKALSDSIGTLALSELEVLMKEAAAIDQILSGAVT